MSDLPKWHVMPWPPCVVRRDDNPDRQSFSVVPFIYAKNRRTLAHEVVHQWHCWAFIGAAAALLAVAVGVAVGVFEWDPEFVWWREALIPLGLIIVGDGLYGLSYKDNRFGFGIWTEALSEGAEAFWEWRHGLWRTDEFPDRCRKKIDDRWGEFSGRWNLTEEDRARAHKLCIGRFSDLMMGWPEATP